MILRATFNNSCSFQNGDSILAGFYCVPTKLHKLLQRSPKIPADVVGTWLSAGLLESNQHQGYKMQPNTKQSLCLQFLSSFNSLITRRTSQFQSVCFIPHVIGFPENPECPVCAIPHRPRTGLIVLLFSGRGEEDSVLSVFVLFLISMKPM